MNCQSQRPLAATTSIAVVSDAMTVTTLRSPLRMRRERVPSDDTAAGGSHCDSPRRCMRKPQWTPTEQEMSALTMQDFEVKGVLGVGTYGIVKLAKHVASGVSVALKVMSKEQVVSLRQEKHILRERHVHLQLRHPFIAHLYGTFQDDNCLYLVIEFLPGGELWSLVYGDNSSSSLAYEEDNNEEPTTSERQPQQTEQTTAGGAIDHKEGELRSVALANATANSPRQMLVMELDANLHLDLSPRKFRHDSPSSALDSRSRGLLRNPYSGLQEDHAVFYLGCILLALEFLHDQELLYRDLKLENLVLDRDGYPKVLDFGFAKPNAKLGSKHMTLCGSMDYMAPEILLHKPHDHRVDIWSFGVIMYELLLGKTPFFHENPRELGRQITSDPVEFPKAFSDQHPMACDLIMQLLVKDPNQRLQSMAAMKSHEFFTRRFPTAQCWDELLNKQISAPFTPKLSGPFDTTFFRGLDEQESLDEDVIPYYEDGSNIFSEF